MEEIGLSLRGQYSKHITPQPLWNQTMKRWPNFDIRERVTLAATGITEEMWASKYQLESEMAVPPFVLTSIVK